MWPEDIMSASAPVRNGGVGQTPNTGDQPPVLQVAQATANANPAPAQTGAKTQANKTQALHSSVGLLAVLVVLIIIAAIVTHEKAE